jgi:hypothetical protein
MKREFGSNSLYVWEPLLEASKIRKRPLGEN